MPAPGELTYYERIGADGREHALNKPFSGENRGAQQPDVSHAAETTRVHFI
jgi:hypothetical protein